MEITVENIKCGGCMKSIENALLKLENVKSVKIDLEEQTISLNQEADRSLVVNKLNELGYPEKGNNDLLKKAKSYVNCAIGRMN